ncbi:hypothetical protein [Hyphomicrobium sp. 2TAF46]|uniref:hypothetical protein n=1 Tax=Hyphomicrobium sp. 2TAF46 TaxID=3233019 RepID=UPI003F925226
MKLEFHDLEFDKIGRRTNDPSRMWGYVTVKFYDTDRQHVVSTEVCCSLSKTPTTTISEIEAEALTQTKSILKHTLELLEKGDLATLMEEGREARTKAWDDLPAVA